MAGSAKAPGELVDHESEAYVRPQGKWFARSGTLTLRNGRLGFVDKRLNQLMDVPAADAAATLATRGMGFSITSGGKKYKVTFATNVSDTTDSDDLLGIAVDTMNEAAERRRAQQVFIEWVQVLTRLATQPGN